MRQRQSETERGRRKRRGLAGAEGVGGWGGGEVLLADCSGEEKCVHRLDRTSGTCEKTETETET